MSVKVSCHSTLSCEKSMSIADQLPFSHLAYRSVYEIWSSGDFVGSSLMLLLEDVVTSQELVQVIPGGGHRRAPGEDAQVAARRGVERDLRGVRQELLDGEHGGLGRQHVR